MIDGPYKSSQLDPSNNSSFFWVYLGVKPGEVFLCFLAIFRVVLGSIILCRLYIKLPGILFPRPFRPGCLVTKYRERQQ